MQPASRVHFCSWFLQSVVEGAINPKLTFFSVEVWFRLQRYINTQNNSYWSSQNPHLTHKVLLHPVKVGVWCAVGARRIVVPVFFNETINFKRYVQVILEQLFPELIKEESLCDWFQQDSTTAHTACMSMHVLSDVFMDRIISSGIWPARSPNLNPCDFFLLGLFEAQSLQQ
jgi:hypothetical protein